MHKQAKDKTSTIAKVSTHHSNLADHIKTNIYLLVVKLNKRIMINFFSNLLKELGDVTFGVNPDSYRSLMQEKLI